jgi:hypothetical protein
MPVRVVGRRPRRRRTFHDEVIEILQKILGLQSIPGLIVELDTFAAHQDPLRLSTAVLATVDPVFRRSAAL